MRKKLRFILPFALAAAIIAVAAYALLTGVSYDKTATALTCVLIICFLLNRRVFR